MQFSHLFDISPDMGADIEVMKSDSYFLAIIDSEPGFDCAGTVGTAGTIGGTAGTFGTFGCCC